MPSNFLITSSSSKVPLIKAAIQSALRIPGDVLVIAGDCDPNALTRFVADGFWLMPPISDCNLQLILAGCLARSITAILPTRDGELQFWSRHLSLFDQYGIKVIVSEYYSICRCLDKLLFSKVGQFYDVPVIPTSTSIDDIKSSHFLVKPRFGSGSQAVSLRLDYKSAVEYSKTLSNPIFQPFIDGIEVSADALVDIFGCIKGLVLRRRELIVNGESHITSTFRDINLELHVKQWIEKYSLYGPVVLQLFIDQSNSPHILEINPRFGGASTAHQKLDWIPYTVHPFCSWR